MQMTVTILPLLVALATAPTLGFPREPSTIPEANAEAGSGSMIKWPPLMYFPDDNGEPAVANIQDAPVTINVQESDVIFKLYTRQGPTEGEIITPGDVDSLRNSQFNASEPTFFVTHGYRQSIEADAVQSIKNMYNTYVKGNVIAVDWSKISMAALYPVVSGQTTQVGEFVGAFTAFLVREAGVDVKHLHLIGHSLGAHVVGIAGKNIQQTVGHKPGRITGLDPAGPQFTVENVDNRLDKEDADFVDVIHTCGGLLGMSDAIGHADYYPNGGTMRQPGCSVEFVTAGICSHSRSWELYAESINTRRFSAQKCTSYDDYLHGNCGSSHKAIMGHHAHKSAKGTFYLKTAQYSPYALG